MKQKHIYKTSRSLPVAQENSRKQHNGIHLQNIKFHWGTTQTLNKNSNDMHFQCSSRPTINSSVATKVRFCFSFSRNLREANWSNLETEFLS